MKNVLFFLLVAIVMVGCEKASEEANPMHTYEAIVSDNGDIADITYKENGKQIHYSNYSATHRGFRQVIQTQEPTCYILLVVSDGGWVDDERLTMSIKKDGVLLFDTTFTKCCQQETIIISKYFK